MARKVNKTTRAAHGPWADCLVFVLVFWLSSLLAPCSCPAEYIYQWVNVQGTRCYSNLSPPRDETHFRAIAAIREPAIAAAPDESIPSITPDSGNTAGAPAALPERLKRVLTQRISDRKKDICAMAQLLRGRVDDQRLRRSLQRKKWYLAEELRRLAELEQ